MKKWLLWSALALVVIVGIISFKINDTLNKDTIYKGVYVEGINMSNKSKEEALKVIKDTKQAELKSQKMTLKGKDKKYDIKLEDIDFVYEYEDAIDKAYLIGRKGNFFEKYKEVMVVARKKEKVELKSHYDDTKIEEKVQKIAKELDVEVRDAKFTLNSGNISISDEKDGYKVDEEKLISQIKENIYKLDNIDIPIDTVKPKYTKEYYSQINGIIGESSTSFQTSAAGRINNIAISARAFNGRIIHPGESLSYNSTLGPVNAASGYQNAPVIVDGDLQPGIGGGICQTSTTLYNALLRADLTITERSHHSIPSAYMDKGLDAVVVGGYLDLKFKNDFDYPVYISSYISGKTVHFKIYGDKKNRDYTIQMQPKIVQVIPHRVKEVIKKDAAPGTKTLAQQGRNGYKVITYKHKVKDGKIIESKQISSDYYREREAIYHIGPKADTPAKKPEQAKPENKPENKSEQNKEEKPKDNKKETTEPAES